MFGLAGVLTRIDHVASVEQERLKRDVSRPKWIGTDDDGSPGAAGSSATSTTSKEVLSEQYLSPRHEPRRTCKTGVRDRMPPSDDSGWLAELTSFVEAIGASRGRLDTFIVEVAHVRLPRVRRHFRPARLSATCIAWPLGTLDPWTKGEWRSSQPSPRPATLRTPLRPQLRTACSPLCSSPRMCSLVAIRPGASHPRHRRRGTLPSDVDGRE